MRCLCVGFLRASSLWRVEAPLIFVVFLFILRFGIIFLKNCGKIDIIRIVSFGPFLCAQFSSMKDAHSAGQQSPPYLSRNFSSSPTETVPVNHQLFITSPWPLVTSVLLSVTTNVATLGTSDKQSYTVFVLPCRAYFSQYNGCRAHQWCRMYQNFFFLFKAESYSLYIHATFCYPLIWFEHWGVSLVPQGWRWPAFCWALQSPPNKPQGRRMAQDQICKVRQGGLLWPAHFWSLCNCYLFESFAFVLDLYFKCERRLTKPS